MLWLNTQPIGEGLPELWPSLIFLEQGSPFLLHWNGLCSWRPYPYDGEYLFSPYWIVMILYFNREFSSTTCNGPLYIYLWFLLWFRKVPPIPFCKLYNFSSSHHNLFSCEHLNLLESQNLPHNHDKSTYWNLYQLLDSCGITNQS